MRFITPGVLAASILSERVRASRTFWLLLSQVLDEDGSCRKALRKTLAWLAVGLYLRQLKITMGMDVLRCKTPDMAHKELHMRLIACNLVRAVMRQATSARAVHLERLSLEGGIVTIRQ